MKRLISALLVLALCLSIGACGFEMKETKPSYEEPNEETKALLHEYYIHVWNLQEGGYWNTETEEELPEYVSGQALYKEVYAFLQGASAVDEWIDSEYVKQTFEERIFASSRQGILDRFTVLEDVILSQELVYEDALGNICIYEPPYAIEYSIDGACIYENTYSYNMSQYRVTMPTFEDAKKEYTYDANGNATEIRYLSLETEGFVIAVDTYTYNADGSVATAHCVTSDGAEHSASYTYENGNVVKVTGNLPENTKEINYLYDAQGRLVEERQTKATYYGDSWDVVLHFAYEGSNTVPTTAYRVWKEKSWNDPEKNVYRDIVYWQYDLRDDGKLAGGTVQVWEGLYEEYTDFETAESRTLELKLTYGDYYFYNAEEN